MLQFNHTFNYQLNAFMEPIDEIDDEAANRFVSTLVRKQEPAPAGRPQLALRYRGEGELGHSSGGTSAAKIWQGAGGAWTVAVAVDRLSLVLDALGQAESLGAANVAPIDAQALCSWVGKAFADACAATEYIITRISFVLTASRAPGAGETTQNLVADRFLNASYISAAKENKLLDVVTRVNQPEKWRLGVDVEVNRILHFASELPNTGKNTAEQRLRWSCDYNTSSLAKNVHYDASSILSFLTRAATEITTETQKIVSA